MHQCSHHTHHQHHPHEEPADRTSWRLQLTMGLVGLYFLAELIGGWWTNSLALLADAGHMFSDLAALGISVWAARLRRRPPSGQQTFGFLRAEILAALANGALLFLVAGRIVWESWQRFWEPGHVHAEAMLVIAVGGLLVNLLSLATLHGGHQHDLNVRGAWLHVLGDTLGSVAVIIAAVLLSWQGWTWADPVASVVVCLIILYSAGHLVAEALHILMEHAPIEVPVDKVRELLVQVPGVREVHCLHVWTIASGLPSISAHVVVDSSSCERELLSELHHLLRAKLPVDHITLQVETSEFPECSERAPCLHPVSH